MLPDADGQPAPISYSFEHVKPHRLSVVDIDQRDLQLAVYVDGDLRGHTSGFDLNKNINCGEDARACLNAKFSGGAVVVPPGKHTVMLTWVGKGGRCVPL